MYIEGLNREPFNLVEHKSLREVGMRRKIGGGKSPGLGFLGPKNPYKGKTPKELDEKGRAKIIRGLVAQGFRFEAILKRLAKDVGNLQSMITFVRNAALIAQDEERERAVRQQMVEVTVWMAGMARDNNRTAKSPKLEVFIELADHLEKLTEFAEALKCIQCAIQLKPNDMELASRATMAALYAIERWITS